MSPVTFLNICHAVILTVVVTLSANSNIWVSFDRSVILLNMGYVFLLLCTHGTFTFWGAGCFCIPKNTLQLCFGMQLICLETVWPFWVWFCDLLGRCETLLSLQLITSHFWGEIFLNTLPNIPWIMFSNLAIGNSHSSQSCVSASHCSRSSFWMVLFPGFSNFLIFLQWLVLCWRLKVDPLKISKVLSQCSFLLSGTIPYKV